MQGRLQDRPLLETRAQGARPNKGMHPAAAKNAGADDAPIVSHPAIERHVPEKEYMRFTRDENPEQVEQYGHIKPAPTFGPLRCFARCPGAHYTCTRSKGHNGPHVAHTFFKKVAAVWDEDE